jgi:periplasmic protein TonB
VKRLAVAAVLAVAIHVALFRVQVPWTQPRLLAPQSRAVDINLVTIQNSEEKPAPLKPRKIIPKPKPEPPRPEKPITKPVIQPRPVPRAVKPEPVPEPSPAVTAPVSVPPPEETVSESATAMPAQDAARSDEEHAAVRVSVPLYDLNPPPVYPRVARRRNYQGTVLLDVRVTADGRAAEVKVAQTSGYKVLDQSALSAVQGWRFEPARRGALPMEIWVQVPVKFELK